MKAAIRVRMTEVLVAFVLIIAAIALAEWAAWQEIKRLREELQFGLSQHLGSDRLRAAILHMHEAWAACSAGTLEEGDPAHFQSRAAELETLLRQELTINRGESSFLKELAVGLKKYRDLASRILSLGGGASSAAAATVNQQMESEFLRMMSICQQYTEADGRTRHDVLERARAALGHLQTFLLAATASLVLCSGVVAVLAYRRLVGPLHSTLAETRTILERQEKLASLGVFAAGIAHEIRNPITAIKVRLFTLKTSHEAGSSEQEDLEVIESEISRLERIVQDFLRFARPAEPEFEVVPVDRFLRDVHQLVGPELRKRGIEFNLDLKARALIRIDPEKMKQVLINFVQNAADSIEGEGAVTLSSKQDRLAIEGRTLPAIVIIIADTGKGIPPEVEKRLFDPFFTTKEKGTGLGLPIAARIVEKHGGLIRYQTEVNRGTTFSILLPRIEP